MLTLVIAESALELVPQSIVDHPVIVRSAQKRGKLPEKMLLDSNFHHAAMRNLRDAHKRGRPDIVHVALLCAQESVVNKQGLLNVYVHTWNDDIISVNPETRIPRSYNRFCGLVEALFEKGLVRDLLRVEKKLLNPFLESLPGKKVIMHEKGDFLHLEKDLVCVVGGFPHGDFETELPYPRSRISSENLTAWAVVSELTVRYELL